MKRPSTFSQRLLRKGPLVEETYRLFAGWSFEETSEQNLRRAFNGQFKTIGWEKEVTQTTGQRLKSFDLIRPLIILAMKGAPFADWRDCWRLFVGATEQPFGGFALDWLYSEFASGRYQIQAENAKEFAVAAWKRHSPKRPLSSYGVTRMARDLFRTSADLGMLAGTGASKTFAPIAMRDAVVLFYAQMIAYFEGSSPRVATSELWRLAYMSPADVHASLLHLHQFKRVDYQIAGSLVQLALPHESALAYAESFHA
jgi:hypothetical protein